MLYGDHKKLEQILAEAKQLSPIELSELLTAAQQMKNEAGDPLAGLCIDSNAPEKKTDGLMIDEI